MGQAYCTKPSRRRLSRSSRALRIRPGATHFYAFESSVRARPQSANETTVPALPSAVIASSASVTAATARMLGRKRSPRRLNSFEETRSDLISPNGKVAGLGYAGVAAAPMACGLATLFAGQCCMVPSVRDGIATSYHSRVPRSSSRPASVSATIDPPGAMVLWISLRLARSRKHCAGLIALSMPFAHTRGEFGRLSERSRADARLCRASEILSA
jgi:hypothetical protein